MAVKFQIVADGCIVTTSGKSGAETSLKLPFETALKPEDAIRAFQQHVAAAPSMRAAALTFVNIIQESGVLQSWFNGGKVTPDMLGKMREAENIILAKIVPSKDGESDEDRQKRVDELLKGMRTPGSYADARSLALKCWSHGIALKQGEDETGKKLLTSDAMRKILLAFRKQPEPTTVDDILEELEQRLVENPKDIEIVQIRMNKIMERARSLLDQAAKMAELKDAAVHAAPEDLAKAIGEAIGKHTEPTQPEVQPA